MGGAGKRECIDFSTDLGPPNRVVYFAFIFFEWPRRVVAGVHEVATRRDRGATDAGDGRILVLAVLVVTCSGFSVAVAAAEPGCGTAWPRWYREAATDADAGRRRELGVTKHVVACALAGRAALDLRAPMGVLAPAVADPGDEHRGSAAARIRARSCNRARACARASASCCAWDCACDGTNTVSDPHTSISRCCLVVAVAGLEPRHLRLSTVSLLPPSRCKIPPVRA